MRRYALSMQMFYRWVRSEKGEKPYADQLSAAVLLSYYDFLRDEKPRADSTLRKAIETVCGWWSWCAAREEVELDGITYTVHVPPPVPIKDLGLRKATRARVRAPSWELMDAAIQACTQEHLRRQAILMRCTGLRIDQVMNLEWQHMNLADGVMHVTTGKGNIEAEGRHVPIALVLRAELATWDRKGLFVVPTYRNCADYRDAREARSRDMARVWKRAGIPEEYWRGRPHHAFRKGFISCLKREGADEEAVETLVGHSLDLRGKYLDPDFLPMLEAVAMVPPLPREKRKAADVVPIRKKAATG